MAHTDLAEIREVVGGIAETGGFRLAVLFGSAARGSTQPEDLDIGVLADGLIDTVALTNQLTRSLRRQEVDVTDLRAAPPILLALVAREGIPLYERTSGEFARFASLAIRRFADTRKFRDAAAARLREVAETRASGVEST